ncbi:MAG: hypothetical protein ACOCQC_03230 [Halanaerobiaceae bacterium]
MVLEFSTAFALRCPDCGHMDAEQINIFQLSGDSKYTVRCNCGSEKGVISRCESGSISLVYYCLVCSSEHALVITPRRFWSGDRLFSLNCLETDLNLGYYGSYTRLNEKMARQKRDLNSLASELGFDDFADPEVMLNILDRLHDIAEKSGLYCQCGSPDINIELFSDRINLVCGKCNNSYEVSASKPEDVNKLKMSDELILKIT